jgi:hypothetical protein
MAIPSKIERRLNYAIAPRKRLVYNLAALECHMTKK